MKNLNVFNGSVRLTGSAAFSKLCAWMVLAVFFGTISAAFAQLSRLRADGQRIVNAANQEVLLRGVGLGSWLLQEGYMLKPDFTGGGTQWSVKKRLYDQGQTDAQVETFYQNWRDNFITQADINWIADQGFNCVRIPMHYELFLTASQRAVRNSVARNSGNYTNYVNSMTSWYNNNQLFTDPNLEGFRTLENCLNWAAARGMYVIVDLHAAPGAQGSDANIADALVGNDLWNRAIFQDVTVRLWESIVRRHINNNTVAFWDLINEPNNVPGGGQAIFNLTNRLVNAIRALGDNHLIMIEGNGWGNNYDWLEPNKFSNRSNLVYNAHRYWIPEADDWVRDGNPNQINRMINLIEFRSRWNVPVWVGETGENSDEWLKQNVDKLNAARIGWCHWTYKRTSSSANAALRRIAGPPYLTDGAAAMSGVLNNIRFANTTVNNGPLGAVSPGLGILGRTITLRGFNNQFVSGENGTQPMWCNRPAAGGWEYFTVVNAGSGKVALRSQNKYVSSENGTQAITCSRTAIGDWEKFDMVRTADGRLTFFGNNGRYVSSENGAAAMTCVRTTVGGWETFGYAIAPGGRMEAEEMPESTETLAYPNPVTNRLTYQLPEGLSQHTLQVRDLLGRNVLQTTYGDVGRQNTVDVGEWHAGWYILTISEGQFRKSLKIQKQ